MEAASIQEAKPGSGSFQSQETFVWIYLNPTKHHASYEAKFMVNSVHVC